MYSELKERVESKNNSNFYEHNLTGPTQVWIRELCRVLDGKLERLEMLIPPDRERKGI